MNQSAQKSPSTPAESWFVATESGAVEYSLEALKNEIQRGAVHSRSMVWRKGMLDWVQLEQVPLLRMLATVQPSAQPFVALGASVSSAPLDEQFEDKTTVFTARSDATNTSSALGEEPAGRRAGEIEAPNASPPTSIFDGLFDPAEAAIGAVQEPSTPASENAEVSENAELGSTAELSPAPAPVQVSEPWTPATPVDGTPRPVAAISAASNSAKPGAPRAHSRRNKPDSVPRRQKSGAPEPTRTALTRPATPRVSIAGLSARTVESKPAFQLPKREFITQGFAHAFVSAAARPEPPHAPALVRQKEPAERTAEQPPVGSRPAESLRAASGQEQSAPASTPIILPLPMPALPPPPAAIGATRSGGVLKPIPLRRSEPLLEVAERPKATPPILVRAGSAASGAVVGARPPVVAQAATSVAESIVSAKVIPSPIVPVTSSASEAVGDAKALPSVIVQAETTDPGGRKVQKHALSGESVERTLIGSPFMQAPEGDSLFPSASSIHPGLFRPNRSRRALLLVSSFGLALAATFAIVVATNGPDVATPRPSSAMMQERSSVGAAPNPVAQREPPAATQAASEQPRSTTSGVESAQRKAADLQQATAQQAEAPSNLADSRRLSATAASNTRRSKGRVAGAIAIADSEHAKTDAPAAVEKREAWEEGTVEKRAWMEPGF